MKASNEVLCVLVEFTEELLVVPLLEDGSEGEGGAFVLEVEGEFGSGGEEGGADGVAGAGVDEGDASVGGVEFEGEVEE